MPPRRENYIGLSSGSGIHAQICVFYMNMQIYIFKNTYIIYMIWKHIPDHLCLESADHTILSILAPRIAGPPKNKNSHLGMSQKLVFSEICGGISNFILNTALTIKMESKNKRLGLEDDVPGSFIFKGVGNPIFKNHQFCALARQWSFVKHQGALKTLHHCTFQHIAILQSGNGWGATHGILGNFMPGQ